MLSNQELIIAVVVVLVLFMAYYYYKRHAPIGLSMKDDATTPVVMQCPAGKTISVEKAVYGDEKCKLVDVSAGLGKAANGQNSFTLPATPFKGAIFAVPDPCPMVNKTLTASYVCL